MNLPKQRVYLGVRTCEIFLCFASFVFLAGPIVLTSLFPFFSVTWSFTGSYSKLNDTDTVHSDQSWFNFKQNNYDLLPRVNNSPSTFAFICL